MATDENVLIDQLREKLVIGEKDHVYGLIAPAKLQCRRDDDSYRYVAMEGNEEFLLSGIRLGSRKQVIFEFSPIDAKPYKQMEVDDKAVFALFPELEEMAADALGNPGVSFNTARSKFVRDAATIAKKKKETAEAEQKADEEAKHSDNPMWGMF